MIKSIKIAFSLGIVICFKLCLSAQTNSSLNPTLEQINPPSPNASALGKFGSIPVGPSTGIPQINIPIYSFTDKSNGLRLSVSLDYHAGGIRVDEMSTNVGIGWALNAGGVVSRTMRGIYDEMWGAGFWNSGPLPRDVYEGNQPYNDISGRPFNNMYAWELDGQTDVFNFNFNGRSGKFMFGKNDDLLIINQQKIKIEKIISQIDGQLPGYPMISAFILTDENGFKYVFDDEEITTNRSMATAAKIYTSSWYLTKILAPSGRDSIRLQYENSDFEYDIGKSESQTLEYPGLSTPVPGIPANYTTSRQRIQGKRIKQINFPDGVTMEFLYSSTEKTELSSGDFLLKKISLSSGNLKRGFKLQHDYSLNRPTLKAVIPFNGPTELEDKGYEFSYDAALPDRLSNSQDHWGFCNSNTNGLLPNEVITVGAGGNYGAYHVLGGANRDTDPVLVKSGSLKQIKYPTGGYTSFEMEANHAVDSRLNEIVYVQQLYTRQDAVTAYCTSSSTSNTIFHFQGDPNSETEFKVKIPSSTYTCNSPCKVVMEIKNSSGVLIDLRYYDPPNSSYQPEYTFTLNNLIPGTDYTISTYTQGISNYSVYIDFKWIEERIQNPVNVNISLGHNQLYVGGLRLKKILDYTDGSSLPALVREYEYFLNDNITSSGTLGLYPIYSYGVCYYWGEGGGLGEQYEGVCNSPNYLVRSSSTVHPLAYSNGSPVAYKRVVEKMAGNGNHNGRIERYFRTFFETPVIIDKPFPFTPPEYKEFWNGLLDSTLIYDENSQLIKKEVNEYQYLLDNYWQDSITFENFRSVSIAPVKYQVSPNWSLPRWFKMNSFYPTAGRSELSQTTTYEYNNDKVLKSVVNYQYDSENLYLKERNTINSKGDEIQKIFNYPKDMILSDRDPDDVYQEMVNKNMINAPIEEIHKNDNNQISLIRTNYFKPHVNVYVPKNIEIKINDNPIENRLEFESYSANGNLLQQQKANDTKHSYVWDYNASYPIAEATNAPYSDIAYTSFEADGKGNWTYTGTPFIEPLAPTGKKVYNLSSGNITKSLNSATTYIISYWRPESLSPVSITGTMSGYPVSGRTLNGWKYYEHKISAQSTVTISGSGNIDELRLYPAGALMTTYTYEPLTGMTSQCDVNNRITYYEYDGFGRLMLVRDQDKNILKQLCYNYAGQVQDCNAAYALAAPPAPGNLTAVINAGSAVELNWVNNAVNATVIEVYRSAGDAAHYTLLVTLPDNVSTYTDTQTDINTLYFYKIKAAGSGGSSAYSNEESITTPAVSPSALSNTAPALNGIADIYVRSGSSKTAGITATDDAGDILGFVVSGLPAFASFSENGNGTGAFHLSPVNTAPGSFSVTVKVIDNYGGFSQKVINIIVVDKDTAAYHINFNNIDYPVADPLWNSFNSTKTGGVQVLANTILYALKDETGTASAISVKLLNSWPQNYLGLVTGDDSGVYPDAVIATGYYFYVQASAPAKTIKIAGLKADKKYDLTFYGNRAYGSDQVTNYTVGAQTVTLNARNNTSNTVQITGLAANSQGEIDIVVDADMTKYATINAMVITEYPNN